MPTRGQRLVAVDGRIEMEDLSYPDPGPGQVLVRVTKSLVSAGSEQGLLVRPTRERRPLGYTTVGRVVEAGAGMESFRPGDRVLYVRVPRHPLGQRAGGRPQRPCPHPADHARRDRRAGGDVEAWRRGAARRSPRGAADRREGGGVRRGGCRTARQWRSAGCREPTRS